MFSHMEPQVQKFKKLRCKQKANACGAMRACSAQRPTNRLPVLRRAVGDRAHGDAAQETAIVKIQPHRTHVFSAFVPHFSSDSMKCDRKVDRTQKGIRATVSAQCKNALKTCVPWGVVYLHIQARKGRQTVVHAQMPGRRETWDSGHSLV